MPPPKKTAPKKMAPFAFFCFEQSQTNPKFKGKSLRTLSGDRDISDMWTALPREERARYVSSCQEHNESKFVFNKYSHSRAADADMTGRFDSFGRSLKAVQQKEQMESHMLRVMYSDIRSRLRHLHARERLRSLRMHILHVNFWSSEPGYDVPAEVALVEFTIADGVTRVYNEKVAPGKIPLGFKGEMRTHAEKFHRIWLDNPDLCSRHSDIINVIAGMLTACGSEEPAGFGGEDSEALERRASELNLSHLVEEERERRRESGADKLLPIFVMPELLGRTQKALRWMAAQAKDAGDESPCRDFVLFELPILYHELLSLLSPHGTAAVPGPDVRPTVAEAHLKKDIYLYTPGISCRFHESLELSLCAGAHALRYVFILLDFACRELNIVLVERKHRPGAGGTATAVTNTEEEHKEEEENDDESLLDLKSFAGIKEESQEGKILPDLHPLHAYLVQPSDDQEEKGVLTFCPPPDGFQKSVYDIHHRGARRSDLKARLAEERRLRLQQLNEDDVDETASHISMATTVVVAKK